MKASIFSASLALVASCIIGGATAAPFDGTDLAVRQTLPNAPPEVPVPSIYDKVYQDAIVNEHNRLRKGHCAQPLRWDDNLAQQALADVNTCQEHPTHMRAGSNLMAFGFPFDWIETGHNCSWQWYDEVKDYDFKNPGFTERTAHFTQVVWRDSARIGCAFAACLNTTNVPARFFCYYDPVGNVINPGLFEQNVWPPHSCAE